MELFRTEEFYIFVKGEFSLWWDRTTGAFITKTGWDLTDAEDPICLGVCDGIIGKLEHPAVFDSRLIIIKESTPVGKLHGDHIVYKIKSIAFMPLGNEIVDLNLAQCLKHKAIIAGRRQGSANPFLEVQKSAAFTKTMGTLKTAGNVIKNTTQQAAAMATGTPKKRENMNKERFERQIIEELQKIFTDTSSFYYCHTCDITSSLQRLCTIEKSDEYDINALWKTVDDRFFWNKHMLRDLMDLNSPLTNPWILPVIQGYIQIEDCRVDLPQDIHGVKTSPKIEIFKLCILSRRSRFRAGTRYKRRGVDENGECANYVETEQIIAYHHHEVSFVQLRGSVPVFWSQPGYKYRPPPRIDKGEQDTKTAFENHFSKEIKRYGPVCAINLVDQTGKEKIIWDAYSNHVFQYNSPYVTYVTFDFHEYCRGMHFENVSILINHIVDIIKDMSYCWRDKEGHICSQLGVFRVNCIDCLDRTNVVQTAIGKAVMEIQFCKLGLITPDGTIPDTIKNTFQLLWANNGDIISKQYAGTNALKGDYTRTGERKFTGIMRDGMNSANRYYKSHFTDSLRQCCLDLMQGVKISDADIHNFWHYLRVIGNITGEILPVGGAEPVYIPPLALEQEYELANALYYMCRYYLSRFKDSTRQGTIDFMLGNNISEEIFNEPRVHDEEDCAATAEHVKLLIEDCKKMLINNPELVLGTWGLINADPYTGDPTEMEIDSILILTKDSYFVADYDDQVDKVTKYQQVMLKDLTLIESGFPETATSLFKNNKSHYCIRLNYKVDGITGYYHMFRSTNLRFFNNMAVAMKNEEEEIESLKAICEAFIVAMDIGQLQSVPYYQGKRLERRKSKVVTANSSSSIYLDIASIPQITRNVSETQLLALKNAGTKALSNVTQQFSKLNKLGATFKQSKKGEPVFTIGKTKTETSSDSDDEDDYDESIFQPTTQSAKASKYNTDSSSSDKNHSLIEQGVELTEHLKLDETTKPDTFLPSVGIVMCAANCAANAQDQLDVTNQQGTLEQKDNKMIGAHQNAPTMNSVQLTSIMNNVSVQKNTPEIQINPDESNKLLGATKLDRKLSHSSGEVDANEASGSYYDGAGAIYIAGENRLSKTFGSDRDITLNISQSQSESALKSKLTNLASPVSNATKEMMLSPFSKLGKGLQNLGANFDPRKITGRQVTERDLEEHRNLQEKWRNSKTRLIAL